jgi:hypothetical protein
VAVGSDFFIGQTAGSVVLMSDFYLKKCTRICAQTRSMLNLIERLTLILKTKIAYGLLKNQIKDPFLF